MSQLVPWGRVTPRWSVIGLLPQPLTPAGILSIAGLPKSKASVSVRATVIGQRSGERGIGVGHIAGGGEAAGVAAVQIVAQRSNVWHGVAGAVVEAAVGQAIGDDGVFEA